MVRRIEDLLGYIEERLDDRAIGRGPEYQFWCPFCIDRLGSDGRKRNFGINIVKAKGGCYRCEYGFRTWEKFFRDLNGGHLRIEEIQLLRFQPPLPKKSVAATAEELLNETSRATFVEENRPLKARRLPRECRILADIPKDKRRAIAVRPAFDYLARRGVQDRDIERFQIGYCATGDLAGYLIFPVIQGGRVVYFASRYCGESTMKSFNLPNEEGFHTRATCLLNYDNCRGVDRIALVEGPFDMMAYEHALASMGSHLSERQVALFSGLVDAGLQEVVVSLDPGAGKQMEAACGALQRVVPVVTCLTLEWGDPWDRRADLEALLPHRVPLASMGAEARLQQRMGRK